MSVTFPWPWLYDYSPGAQWEVIPQGIYAGATLRFVKYLQPYPASLWTLTYGLVPYSGAASGPILFQSVPLNGGDWHYIAVLPAVTKSWAPGFYTWQCFAQLNSDATTRDFVSTGTITINADLTSSANGSVDTRGKFQAILDQIDAMILATAGDAYAEIQIGHGTIGSQSLKGWSRDDLIKYRDYIAELAGNEKRIKAMKGGAPNPRYKYAIMTGGLSDATLTGVPPFLP